MLSIKYKLPAATIVATLYVAAVCGLHADETTSDLRVEKVIDVGLVPSSFPVDFCLLTHGDRQYVAYYDQHHQMTVAARALSEDQWQYQPLPSRIWWDSHNYVTMAVDRDGHLHVCGNMHSSRLIYFRTTKPHDITTLERVAKMTGTDERLCTYPKFLRCPDGELAFIYRSGRSGNGKRLLNKYDAETRTWRRLSKPALLDGQGKMNAYPDGPMLGPDGNYHMTWVWRDTFDCSTNHDVCYARSKDLVQWETVSGEQLALPVTPDSSETVVDPVPTGGGLMGSQIGFDSNGCPILSYVKFDETGHTQAYVTRVSDATGPIVAVSNWTYRWDCSGISTFSIEVDLREVRPSRHRQLMLPVVHRDVGRHAIALDELTLRPVAKANIPLLWPTELSTACSSISGMQARFARDASAPSDQHVRHLLRWETLPSNRDLPRLHSAKPTLLQLIRTTSAPPDR